MPSSILTIRIAGEAGEGIIVAGELLAMTAAECGQYVYTFRTYPAEIRGGPSQFELALGTEPIISQSDSLNILIAFNSDAYQHHLNDVDPNGVILYDPADITPQPELKNIQYPVPLTQIAQKQIGSLRAKNMVALGAISGLFNLSYNHLVGLVKKKLGKYDGVMLEKNLAGLQAGYDYIQNNIQKIDLFRVEPRQKLDKLVMSGNQAIGVGAIVAGCRYFAGYPITPASPLLEFLAVELPKFDGTVIQTEDELSVLASVLGASFAGTKAMTATSGPGISLMTELMDLSSMAEIPVVILDVQRAGPSTGMPSKMEQTDLNHVIYAGHGEGPRIVIAPTSVSDCFYQTITAFNLAEKYQMPVIILSDHSLANRQETIDSPKFENLEIIERKKPSETELQEYKRYLDTSTGISPISIPGIKNGMYIAEGLEHNEFGHPNYTPENHCRMTAKRLRKLDTLINIEKVSIAHYGNENAELGIIGWGSTEGAVRVALNQAQKNGYNVAACYPKLLHPLPEKELAGFIRKHKKILVSEINATGQFARILKERFGITPIQLNKCGGIPFLPKEIYTMITQII